MSYKMHLPSVLMLSTLFIEERERDVFKEKQDGVERKRKAVAWDIDF